MNNPTGRDLFTDKKSFNPVSDGVFFGNESHNMFSGKSTARTSSLNLDGTSKKKVDNPFDFQRPDKIGNPEIYARAFFNEQNRRAVSEKLAENIGDTASSEWLHSKKTVVQPKKVAQMTTTASSPLTGKKIYKKRERSLSPDQPKKVLKTVEEPKKSSKKRDRSLSAPGNLPTPPVEAQPKKVLKIETTFRKEKA